MKFKRIFFLIALLVAGSNFVLTAQPGRPQDGRGRGSREDFEAFKQKRVEFITGFMGLTIDEAKDFWPVCNELQEKKFHLNRSLMRKTGEFNAQKEHTEAECKQFIDFCTDQRIKEAKLDKEYYDKFLTILSAKKVYLYLQAELQFARNMLEDRDKKENKK
ncbi:MAG: hypothetical protein LBR13_05875 [Dysgonamonadaceae bacterium]|jgi:hypothetical protein|nr:hypothetical protein [Dysgonamonadaceae bacterium]